MKIFVVISMVFMSYCSTAGNYQKVIFEARHGDGKDQLRKNIAQSLKEKSLRLVDIMPKLVDGEITIYDLTSDFFKYKDESSLIVAEDFSVSGFTPFIWLLLHSYEDNVRNILSHEIFNESWFGAVNEPTKEKYYPLHLAIIFAQTHCHPEIVEQVINKAQNVNQDDGWGMHAIHYAVIANNLEALKAIINNQANIDLQDQNGNSAFMLAVQLERASLIDIFIENKASVSLINSQAKTIVDIETTKDIKQKILDYHRLFCDGIFAVAQTDKEAGLHYPVYERQYPEYVDWY